MANRALDSGPDSRWYRRGLRNFFQDIAAQVDDKIYIQARFDGAFRGKCGRSAIGVCIEYVKRGESRPLFDLGAEVACSDAYQAELLAASRAVDRKNAINVIRTSAAPLIISMLGRSPTPIQTQNGPNTISSNIKRLTIAELV